MGVVTNGPPNSPCAVGVDRGGAAPECEVSAYVMYTVPAATHVGLKSDQDC